ncbi:MAG: hypothetical protein D3923_19405 [Candidatus Electrothrix sp. AR3]|nr:hypothetical protein [Candidatus Electrothrix sp. AR3]
MNIPNEVIKYLENHTTIDCGSRYSEIGDFQLIKPKNLKREYVEIQSKYNQTDICWLDRYHWFPGYYLVSVINLIGESSTYAPDGLLAWFSDLHMFGSYVGRLKTGFLAHFSWPKLGPGFFTTLQEARPSFLLDLLRKAWAKTWSKNLTNLICTIT